MLEDKIIKGCKVRQRNLMRAAKLASDKPDTGVKILKKGAYFVIRDCADITQNYLVHLAYGSYEDPIAELSGKFTEKEIIDFVARTSKHSHTKQLLNIIFADIFAKEKGTYVKQEAPVEEVLDFTETGDEDDIYGDYEYEDSSESVEDTLPQPIDIDMSDGTAIIEKLIEVFNVKR
jgi:hypothetical protein